MPFDGNGIYNKPSTNVTPAVSGATIDSAAFNTWTDDLKSALTNCVCKDGQSTLTGMIKSVGIDVNRAAAEQYILFSNNQTESIGFYGSAVGTGYNVGMYDYKNSQGIFDYTEATKTLNVGTTLTYLSDSVQRIDRSAATSLTGASSSTITGVPSWAKIIHIHVTGASSSGGSTSNLALRIGPSGGVDTTGYRSVGSRVENGNTPYTLGYNSIYHLIGGAATGFISNTVDATIVLVNRTGGNTWSFSSTCNAQDATAANYLSASAHGQVTTSGTLERIELINTVAANFDGGVWSVTYQG